MTQTNSTPGGFPSAGNNVVTSASAEVGPNSSTKLNATLTTVAYTQSEPGKITSPVNTKRM